MASPNELADEEHKPELQFKLRGVSGEHPGLQVSLALVAEIDGIPRCVGSAFAVAPGLAITASHVIADCFGYQEKRDGYKRADSAVSLTAIQLYDQKVFFWLVDESYKSEISDIAFLRFHRPNWWGSGRGQIKPPFARLNLNPPAVGDQVRVFGFPKSELVGGVVNVFPSECNCRVQKVDVKTEQPAWSRPLAHIELEGEIEHGMSGGPCFDKDWNVIGVNSSGWSGLPLAKVALLWPAMNVEIDLFKTGPFPAIDLFKSRDTAALGYKRVYVTSRKEARFANIDPESLAPSRYLGMTESLSGAIDFSASGAQEALAELRATLAKAQTGSEPLDSNRIIRLARNYFWELEAAVKLALLLATRQLNLSIAEPPTWEQVIKAWRTHTTNGHILDEIAMLDFDWNGVDLFELRTYAELARSGVLYVQYLVVGDPSGPPIAASLNPPCRKNGTQLSLPDGLDRFMDAARRFVQRLLHVSALPK